MPALDRSEKIPDRPWFSAAIALGSNLEDRRAHLQGALARLDDHPQVRLGPVSAFFETDPVGGPDLHGPFLNAAAILRTTLAPRRLLELLLALEHAAGRDRSTPATGAADRTLDLDLLFYEDQIIDRPGLRVPHPRLHQRRFVLDPLVSIAPDWVHPVLGRSVRQLWLACTQTDNPVNLPAHRAPPVPGTHP